MDTNKKRAILQEIAYKNFTDNKLEPLEFIKLTEFISNVADKRLDLIIRELKGGKHANK